MFHWLFNLFDYMIFLVTVFFSMYCSVKMFITFYIVKTICTLQYYFSPSYKAMLFAVAQLIIYVDTTNVILVLNPKWNVVKVRQLVRQSISSCKSFELSIFLEYCAIEMTQALIQFLIYMFFQHMEELNALARDGDVPTKNKKVRFIFFV